MPTTIIEQNPKFDKKVKGKNKLSIAELFCDTIQGEGITTGVPSTFLRLQGCTLECHWCFVPQTQVRTTSGKIKIKDASRGDRLTTIVPGTGTITYTEVVDTAKRKVPVGDLRCVRFTGEKSSKLFCTKDHQYYVREKGWLSAERLTPGDPVESFYGSRKVLSVSQLSSLELLQITGNEKSEEVTVHNLKCAPYNSFLPIIDETQESVLAHNCDTLDVWPNGNQYSFDELYQLFEDYNLIRRFKEGEHLILTGGSPLKQQRQLQWFIEGFFERYGFIPYMECENESVLKPSQEMKEYVSQWNNSPKLENSGMDRKKRYKPEVLKELSGLNNSWFKFVITCHEDWEEVQRDFIDTGLIPLSSVILMPEGQTQSELEKTRELTADLAIKHCVKFSDRLHVTIWNERTGV